MRCNLPSCGSSFSRLGPLTVQPFTERFHDARALSGSRPMSHILRHKKRMDSVAIHSFLLAEDNARALHSLLHSFAYSRQTHYAVRICTPAKAGQIRHGTFGSKKYVGVVS